VSIMEFREGLVANISPTGSTLHPRVRILFSE
jgi:hypothetical protein